MKLTPSFFVQSYNNLFCSQRIYLPGQLALQVRRFVLVNDPFLGQPVDHRSNLRQLLARRLLLLDSPQFTDRIPRGLAIILITIPALFGLPYIFLGCLVISHELDDFRTAKVRSKPRTTKSDPHVPPKSIK